MAIFLFRKFVIDTEIVNLIGEIVMNVSGASGVSNNFNSNGLKKVNNNPSFGALRADAEKVLIRQARKLNPEAQDKVLQEITRLAEWAKLSSQVDIGLSLRKNFTIIDTTKTTENFTSPFRFSGFKNPEKGEYFPKMLITATDDGSITGKVGKKVETTMSVSDAIDGLIKLCQKKDKEIWNTRTAKLEESIKSNQGF